MKRQYWPWYAAALVVAIVGAVVLGLPLSTLPLLLVVLACPVMMMVMMGGGHGHGSNQDSRDTHDHRDSADR
ncbi:DUF2933 domain-containing protein [Mycolicibacterium cosmeticum]|uniref:DUF2933 domain-containing protein n=1 Tax=Mycolicibacterium cosmeticum TaxID=258533 RepID=UPI003204856F